MTRLFWHIFLAFWLSTTVLLSAIALSLELNRAGGLPEPIRASVQGTVASSARAAGLIYEAEGAQALRALLDDMEAGGRLEAHLTTGAGADVLGDPLPDAMAQLARAGQPQALPAERDADGRRYMAVPAVAPSGARYLLVAALNPPRFNDRSLWRASIGEPLLLSVAISAVVSLLLVRWFTGPLAGLRLATQQIADGRLETRVGKLVARRRDAFGELGRDFDRMAERMQQAIEAQKQLLRDVSHELRSPLARFAVALELAKQRGGAANELERMARELERMEDLVGEILALSRLESLQAPSQRERVDLRALLESVVADARFEAVARNIEVQLDATQAFELDADPELLRRGLDNVVRNALTHSPDGSRVEVSCSIAPDHAEVCCRDHGPGVPADQLDRIFEPFVRLDNAAHTARGGGLGLAIARQAARLHGGRIEARNHDQGGLCVYLTLPAA